MLKTKSEFSKNVLTLMTGTTIAQAIPISITPILTRIYTPSDFGLFALFISFVSIVSSISSARYELAILLPHKDEDAINIFALGLIINFMMSIFTLFMIMIFNSEITNLLGNPDISLWLYIVPLSIFLIGIFNNLNYFNNRKKNYKDISQAIILKSIITAVVQIVVGFLKNGATGLITGQIASQFFANLKLTRNIVKDKVLISNITLYKIKFLAKEHIKFPLYTMPATLLNNLNGNMTNVLISTFYGLNTLGLYSLTQRLLSLPSQIIGSSISQVFYQEANEEKKLNNNCINTFKRTLKKLLLIAIPFFLITYFIVEEVFIFVFGEQWAIAGIYAQIILPFTVIRFITAPSSTVLSIFGKQNIELLINIILLSTTLTIFLISNSILEFLNYFSISMSCCYLLFLFYFYFLAKGKKNV